MRLLRIPRLWFTFATPVRRLEFAVSGVLLALLKYVVDAALYRTATGRSWTPLSYLHPFATQRFRDVPTDADWLPWAMAVWIVPFLWIGASMTVRRCMDAGLTPWLAGLFFAPTVNWVFLAVLCVLPARAAPAQPPTMTVLGARPTRALWRGVAAGAAVGFAMPSASALWLGEYGAALFVGAPFVLGAVAAYAYNRPVRGAFEPTASVALIALAVAGAALLMFALEGAICLVMSIPLAIPLTILGALLGWELAGIGPSGPAVLTMGIALPLLLGGDVAAPAPVVRAVRTSVVVDAPREIVWRHVVSFPPLAPAEELVFRAGIAAPIGATLPGSGVGAIRRCTFTTGDFVEPITAWNEPELLAFDVVSQPAPMREISPWSRVFAPHLSHSLVSRRGEFRLTALRGGKTRLEGTTWYSLEMQPSLYWTAWSDAILHAIHRRVLDHVAMLSESDPSTTVSP